MTEATKALFNRILIGKVSKAESFSTNLKGAKTSAAFFFLIVIGELYTWGKGRYGRLGHGDSEDHMKPKLVEALLGYRVIDVACGKQFHSKCIDCIVNKKIALQKVEKETKCNCSCKLFITCLRSLCTLKRRREWGL